MRVEPAPAVDLAPAADPITMFGADLLMAIVEHAAPDQNVVISPLSVAIALAMLEPGAVGDAQRELRALLRVDDPEAFHEAMNALQHSLESREVGPAGGEEAGDLLVRIANAAYLQDGYPVERRYLDAIGRHYGPVIHPADFRRDPDAVAHEINRFAARATEDRITDIVADGVLSEDTVLALVNALYLKASWSSAFDEEDTQDGPFTRRDGSAVTVPLMRGSSSTSAAGDGWVGASKIFAGGLAAQFILPAEGRFDDVARNLARVLDEFERTRTSGALLVVPRFETRFHTELKPAFESLGLRAPYQQGNLLGIADDHQLVLDRALHETWLAIDEAGLEAAAVTALTVGVTSAPVRPPVNVVLDRPFLFRIYDQETGATLFLGHIHDPAPTS